MDRCFKCKSENIKIGTLSYYKQIQAFCYSCKTHYHKDDDLCEWEETTSPKQLQWNG